MLSGLIVKSNNNVGLFKKLFISVLIYTSYAGKHNDIEKRRLESDKAFSKRILVSSPKYSGVLLRNYLLKREKMRDDTSFYKAENSASLCIPRVDRITDKSRKCFYTTKCNPLVLTNWMEVSRRRECRSRNAFTASTSGESRDTVSCLLACNWRESNI